MNDLSSAEIAARIISSYAIDMDRTATQAKQDGASEEVLANYAAIGNQFWAAAAWLRTRDTSDETGTPVSGES